MRTLTILLLLCSAAAAQTRQVTFCNEYPRVSATRLAEAYFEGERLQAQWFATAENDRMTVLGESIIAQAKRLKLALVASRATSDQWLAEGGTALVPNDATVIADGAPSDGRPEITGAEVVGVITQVSQFANWLDHGEYVATVEHTDNGAYRHAIMRVAMSTAATLDATDAATVITRCAELSAEIEANTNARLNVLLAVAVTDPTDYEVE